MLVLVFYCFVGYQRKTVANSINSGASESIGSKFGSSNDLHLMSPTKKAISRAVELGLECS
jgi:hypothetical protein